MHNLSCLPASSPLPSTSLPTFPSPVRALKPLLSSSAQLKLPSSSRLVLSGSELNRNLLQSVSSSSSSPTPSSSAGLSARHKPTSSIRTIFDAAAPPLTTTADPIMSGVGPASSSGYYSSQEATPPGHQSQSHSPAEPRVPSQEDELVRRIHRKVGGPAKLSTYDEPARVRRVVIEALATEQRSPGDASRVRRGQLSALERRVVRTVTNRGAAVRSRMRQRKELAALKLQVRDRDGRVKQLEAIVRAICSTYAVPLPPSVRAEAEPDDSTSPSYSTTTAATDSQNSSAHTSSGTGNPSPVSQTLSSPVSYNPRHIPTHRDQHFLPCYRDIPENDRSTSTSRVQKVPLTSVPVANAHATNNPSDFPAIPSPLANGFCHPPQRECYTAAEGANGGRRMNNVSGLRGNETGPLPVPPLSWS